jgi:hypothetical protein
MTSIIILYGIIFLINLFWVFGFFTRLVGIETKRWSTTNSIFQIINLIPRTIGVLQIPLITLYIEKAINENKKIDTLFFQGIIFFNLIGVLAGLILLPIFSKILSDIIVNIYDKATFKVLIQKKLWKKTRLSFNKIEYKSFYNGLRLLKINRNKLLINNLIAAFLICIAFPACILAGYNIPAYRATIISSVSIIYGISTFISVLLIDTRVSVITDQTFHGIKTLHQYKEVLFDCLKGRIIGIIIGILALPHISKFIIFIFKYYI